MKLFYVIFLTLFSTLVYAKTIIQPTPASKPLPTMKETKNPDTVLREVVQKRIRQVPALKNQPISASSFNRIIRLEGSVDTRAQEDAAIKAAQSVLGVEGVYSQLTIRYDSPKHLK